MTKTVNVTVYELRWPGTTEVYVGSTVRKLSDRLAHHRCRPRPCYQHFDINQAQIVPVLTYTTSDRNNRRPEAAHKAQLRKQNILVLSDPNDNHHSPLWLSAKTKAKMSASLKGKYKGAKSYWYGKQFDDEHKAKLSAAHKGAKNHQYAPFQVTWPYGTVHRFETTDEAAAVYDVSGKSIWNYLNGKSAPGRDHRTAHLKGTVWAYV